MRQNCPLPLCRHAFYIRISFVYLKTYPVCQSILCLSEDIPTTSEYRFGISFTYRKAYFYVRLSFVFYRHILCVGIFFAYLKTFSIRRNFLCLSEDIPCMSSSSSWPLQLHSNSCSGDECCRLFQLFSAAKEFGQNTLYVKLSFASLNTDSPHRNIPCLSEDMPSASKYVVWKILQFLSAATELGEKKQKTTLYVKLSFAYLKTFSPHRNILCLSEDMPSALKCPLPL